MSVLQAQLQGRSAVGTCIVEAGGAFASLTAAHAATDSFKHMSYSSTPAREDVTRRDVRIARDEITVLTRNRSHEWQLGAYFLPRLTTTPPDMNPFWRAAFGTETIGGASVTYSYARVPPSLAFIITGGEPTAVAQEKVVGALINETQITLEPNNEPMVQFSGIASNIVRVNGVGTVASGASSTTQTLGAGEAVRFQVGSIIEFVGVGTNRRVTARNLGANTITVDSSVTTSGGEIVRAYTPWDDAAANQGGEPIASWNGSISIAGSSTYALAGATITMANNWTEKRVQFNNNFIDAGVGFRTITGTLTFFARSFDLDLLARAEENPGLTAATNPVSCTITIGDTTNGQVVLTMPLLALHRTALSIPEDGDATFELGFTALSTRTSGVPNNDALVAVWS